MPSLPGIAPKSGGIGVKQPRKLLTSPASAQRSNRMMPSISPRSLLGGAGLMKDTTWLLNNSAAKLSLLVKKIFVISNIQNLRRLGNGGFVSITTRFQLGNGHGSPSVLNVQAFFCLHCSSNISFRASKKSGQSAHPLSADALVSGKSG